MSPLQPAPPESRRPEAPAAREAPPGSVRARALCCGPAAATSTGNCFPRPAGDAPQRKPPDPLLPCVPPAAPPRVRFSGRIEVLKAATRPWATAQSSGRSGGADRPARVAAAEAGRSWPGRGCGARGRGQSRISEVSRGRLSPRTPRPGGPVRPPAMGPPSPRRYRGSLVPKLPPPTSLQDGAATRRFPQDAPLWMPPTAAPGSTQVTPTRPYSRLPQLSSWPRQVPLSVAPPHTHTPPTTLSKCPLLPRLLPSSWAPSPGGRLGAGVTLPPI